MEAALNAPHGRGWCCPLCWQVKSWCLGGTQQGDSHDGFIPNGWRAQGCGSASLLATRQDKESCGPSPEFTDPDCHLSPPSQATSGSVLLFRLRPSGSAVGRNLPGQEFTARPCSVSGWGWGMAQLFRVFKEPQEMPRMGFSCIWFLTSEPPYCQDREHLS